MAGDYAPALAEVTHYQFSHAPDEPVTLEEELAYTRMLVKLLAVRFDLALNLPINPAMAPYKLLPFTLQTLLESALVQKPENVTTVPLVIDVLLSTSETETDEGGSVACLLAEGPSLLIVINRDREQLTEILYANNELGRLADLRQRYARFGSRAITVRDEAQRISVQIPLQSSEFRYK